MAGICISLSILFLKAHPIWAMGVSAFFALFHLGDLLKFYRERRYLPLLFRPLVIVAVAGFIGGFVWFSVGAYFSPIDGYIALAVIAITIATFQFRFTLWEFFPDSRWNKSLKQTADGFRAIGVFW